MKSILIDLRCPFCGCQTHKKSETYISAEFETKLRREILEDRFFQQVCPCCHRTISFLHPCLYQDHSHGFTILLQTKHADTQLLEETAARKRLVFDNATFMEKIRIFEDGLQDTVMECMKLQLRKKLKLDETASLFYQDFDRDSQTLWFQINEQEQRLIALERRFYTAMEKRIPKDENEKKFKIVDQDYAAKIIRFC